MFIITPTAAEEHYFKSKFKIAKGNLVRMNDESCGKYCVFDGNKYSLGFVRQLIAGMKPDVSDLFEKRDDGYYRSQDPVWAQHAGTLVRNPAKVCGREFSCNENTPQKQRDELDYSFVVTPPDEVIRYVKKNLDKISGNTITVLGTRYPIEYIQAILENKNPDLGKILFCYREGELYRNNHPFWGANKNVKVQSTSKVCGEVITAAPLVTEGPDTTDSLVDPSPYVVSHIKNKYNLNNLHGDFVFINGTLISDCYPIEYVKAVLENKKPNLNILFNIRKGKRIRNNHPIWKEYAGKICKGKHYRVAGEMIPVELSDEKIEIDKYEWMRDLEVLENGDLKIGREVGRIFKHKGIVYTRPYLLSLRDNKPLEKYEGGEMFLFRRYIIGSNNKIKPIYFDDIWGTKKLRWISAETYINDRVYTRDQIAARIAKARKEKEELGWHPELKEYPYQDWHDYWASRITASDFDGEDFQNYETGEDMY